MTEAEELDVKNELRAAVKKYARLKARDMANEISAVITEAATKAGAVEHDDEDMVMDVIEQKFGNSAPQAVKEMRAMLDNCDAKHSAIIKERDAAINAIVLKYINEPLESTNTEAPTSGAV